MLIEEHPLSGESPYSWAPGPSDLGAFQAPLPFRELFLGIEARQVFRHAGIVGALSPQEFETKALHGFHEIGPHNRVDRS